MPSPFILTDMEVERIKGIGFYPNLRVKITLDDNELVALVSLLQDVSGGKKPSKDDISLSKLLLTKIIKG